MDDFTSEFFCLLAAVSLGTVIFIGGIAAVDYAIRAQPTVDSVNKQCGTNYVPMDYLRIGSTAMLQMCETREKRIELKR